MPPTFPANGSTTTDGTEQNLFTTVTGNKFYGAWVFAHNMASGDSVILRVYITDIFASVERKAFEDTFSDAQSPEGIDIPMIPASTYRVTIQRTAGTDRTYTWFRAEA